MNNETAQDFETRIEGMLAMGYLSTIPPLRCASTIEASWKRDALPVESCGVSQPEPYDPASHPACLHGWDLIKGGGLYDVVGYAATSYVVSERLLDIVRTGKKIVVIGEDNEDEFLEMCRTYFGEDVVTDWFSRVFVPEGDDVPFSLNDEDDALSLRDLIATNPIGAVVLLHQEDNIEHLDLIKNVAVYRGKERVHVKKIPIFHVHYAEWLETAFTKVVAATVVNEEERTGCTQPAYTITKEHRLWLWPGYLGLNKVTHFAGASAAGKSPVTLDIAGRVSAGADWPDGAKNTLGPKSVILLAAEDDWSDTIIPRLELAGADLAKIRRFYVKQDGVELTPNLDSDCQRLGKQIAEIGDVALVVIDPVTNYLGSKKMNAEEEMRGILMPLADVAKVHDCAIITVGHLNKRGAEATANQRLMGAAAFGGVARNTFMFGDDPEEDDKYAHVMAETRDKSAPKLKYRTKAVKVAWGDSESDVISVKWGGISHADVDEVVNPSKQQEKNMTSRAVMLISGMLRGGEKRKSEIDHALKENGIDPEKLQWSRIKTRCKADARPLPGKGAGWVWFIATKQENIFQGEASNE